MLIEFKDFLIRKLATSFILKWADGHKTDIMRVVQAINVALVAAFQFCDYIPAIGGLNACVLVGTLNAKWVLLGVVLGHIGLEFGIQDGKAKERAL